MTSSFALFGRSGLYVGLPPPASPYLFVYLFIPALLVFFGTFGTFGTFGDFGDFGDLGDSGDSGDSGEGW